jgi:hypothetical protein
MKNIQKAAATVTVGLGLASVNEQKHKGPLRPFAALAFLGDQPLKRFFAHNFDRQSRF